MRGGGGQMGGNGGGALRVFLWPPAFSQSLSAGERDYWQVIVGRAGVPNRKPLGDLEAGGLEPRLERGGLAALSQVQDQTRLALLFVNPSRQGGPSGGPQRV